MKALDKQEGLFLNQRQIIKVLLVISIMTLTMYSIAMICSLCGSKLFILDYHNDQMDKIEDWLRKYKIVSLLSWAFSTVEFIIVECFVLKKVPKWYFILSYYGIRVIIAFIVALPSYFNTIYTIVMHLLVLTFNTLINKHKLSFRPYLRFLIAMAITLLLEGMIFVIKAGYFDGVNHIMSLSTHFMYATEYNIALSVLLLTIALLIDKGKGDSLWTIYHIPGGSSQTSKKQLLKSKKKNLSKAQKTKLRLLYLRIYLIQISCFLVVMILPFLTGKVFEFLVMYAAFAIVRYILGFKASLHFTKEAVCFTVGTMVFGVLTLAVPFFNAIIIVAILLGVGLAIILHLSYRYRSMYFFVLITNTDRYANLYVFFDCKTDEQHLRKMGSYHGLSKEQIDLLVDYMAHKKIMYLAKKYHYAERTINNKLDEIVEKLNIH